MRQEKKAMLSWVAGNDVTLSLWLYEKREKDPGVVAEEAFDFTTVTEVQVRLVSALRSWTLDCQAGSLGENQLVVEVPYTLPPGLYGVEVSGLRDGVHVRSFEWGAVRIVEWNQRAETVLTRVGGVAGAEYRLEMQVLASASVRAQNAYEAWRQVAGNGEGTFAEFLGAWTASAEAASRRLRVRIMPRMSIWEGTGLDGLAQGALLARVDGLLPGEELRLAYRTVRKRHRQVEDLMTPREAEHLDKDFEWRDDVADGVSAYWHEGLQAWVSRTGVYGEEAVWKTISEFGVGVASAEEADDLGLGETCREGFRPVVLCANKEMGELVDYQYVHLGRKTTCNGSDFFPAGDVKAATVDSFAYAFTYKMEWKKDGRFFLFRGQNCRYRNRKNLERDEEGLVTVSRAEAGLCIWDSEREAIVELVPIEIRISGWGKAIRILEGSHGGWTAMLMGKDKSRPMGNMDVLLREMKEKRETMGPIRA